MCAEERDRDPLEAESQAGRVRLAATGEPDPVGGREVILVIVEGGHCGWLGLRDLGQNLELQLLLALAGGEHSTAAPEERIDGDVELDLQADAAQKLDRAVTPDISPGLNGLRLADADDLALVE